jgi:hypothetical protein
MKRVIVLIKGYKSEKEPGKGLTNTL